MNSNGFSGIFYGTLKWFVDERHAQLPNFLPERAGGPLSSVRTACQGSENSDKFPLT